MKRWVPRPGARVRLFCLPWAGGAAVAFRGWAARFPATVEVCAIEYPGRGSREAEPPLEAVDALAAGLEAATAPLLDVPFAVLGYSLGALVAYEWLRSSPARARSPLRFFPCAHRAPHLVDDARGWRDLPADAFVAEVRRRFQAIPDLLLEEPELLARFVLPLRADLHAVERYRYTPGRRLACPISAFAGARDHDVTRSHLQAWADHTSAGCAVEQVDAGHFFLASPRLRAAVLEGLGVAHAARPA